MAALERMAPISIELESVNDIVSARKQAREFAQSLGFGLADQTRLATAVSEIARNALQYAGNGRVDVSDVSTATLLAVRFVVADRGPGIANIAQAMGDGYTSNHGMGLGLPGCKRLMDAFSIESEVGHGTTIQAELHNVRSTN